MLYLRMTMSRRAADGEMKRSFLLMIVFCFLLSFSAVVLAQTSKGQHLYVSPKVLDDYKITIEGEKKEIENLNTLISESRKKLEQYEALVAEDKDIGRELKQQLEQDLELYSLASGDVAVKGPGVKVYIDDGQRKLESWETPNNILVHDSDLLLIINDLKASGAEAISINGQRIVDVTAISCSGYTVRINDQFFARPFRIEAIGDGSRMSAALIGPGGYGTELKEWGLIFKVTVADDILIPAYAESHAYKYISPAVN